MHWGRTALLLLALSIPAWAGTPGIFRGTLRPTADSQPGWVYIQARNGSLRRVEITDAQVTYADTVPAARRAKKPSKAALNGAEVRVTAEQDGQGEWRARQIEVLKLPPR